MTELRFLDVPRPPFTALGLLGNIVGCAAMAAVLPGAIASVLGVIGITGSSAFARTLAPAAEPLFIVSAVMLVLGGLFCSKVVTLLLASGSALLYVSMFELASGGGKGGGMMAMTNSAHTAGSHADAPTFYSGLSLLAATMAASLWRRRRAYCRPVLRLSRAAAR